MYASVLANAIRVGESVDVDDDDDDDEDDDDDVTTNIVAHMLINTNM